MSGSNTAVELLKLGDDCRQKPLLSTRVWPWALGLGFGIASGMFINFTSRRPYFSGIQKHVAFTAGWIALLNYGWQKRIDYFAEKDAVYLHYIELHPDDFKEPEKKKIGDTFETWNPIR